MTLRSPTKRKPITRFGASALILTAKPSPLIGEDEVRTVMSKRAGSAHDGSLTQDFAVITVQELLKQ